MRFLLKIELPNESANAAIKSGNLPKTIQSILEEQKPEVAYFLEWNGRRTGVLIIEIKDAAQIPAIAEPWFLDFNANIEFHPAMSPEDLGRAFPAIENAAKKYG